MLPSVPVDVIVSHDLTVLGESSPLEYSTGCLVERGAQGRGLVPPAATVLVAHYGVDQDSSVPGAPRGVGSFWPLPAVLVAPC